MGEHYEATEDKTLTLKEIYIILLNDKSMLNNNTYKNNSTCINDRTAQLESGNPTGSPGAESNMNF